jgi:hypothetical protein
MQSIGCTRLDNACLQTAEGSGGEGAARISVVLALNSALATPPSAALTARGNLNVPSAISFDSIGPLGNGLMISSGGPANALNALPPNLQGTPLDQLIRGGDSSLVGLTAPQLFTSLFRMDKGHYKTQPATVVLGDCAAACSGKLADAVQAHPGRVIWVEGDMSVESDVVLGSPTEPVLIVATGNINLDAPSIQVFGLLYSQAGDWNNGGLGVAVVRGAAVAEGNFGGNGIPTFQYDPAILSLLKLGTGSLVRVPGSWRDFL